MNQAYLYRSGSYVDAAQASHFDALYEVDTPVWDVSCHSRLMDALQFAERVAYVLGMEDQAPAMAVRINGKLYDFNSDVEPSTFNEWFIA